MGCFHFLISVLLRGSFCGQSVLSFVGFLTCITVYITSQWYDLNTLQGSYNGFLGGNITWLTLCSKWRGFKKYLFPVDQGLPPKVDTMIKKYHILGQIWDQYIMTLFIHQVSCCFLRFVMSWLVTKCVCSILPGKGVLTRQTWRQHTSKLYGILVIVPATEILWFLSVLTLLPSECRMYFYRNIELSEMEAYTCYIELLWLFLGTVMQYQYKNIEVFDTFLLNTLKINFSMTSTFMSSRILIRGAVPSKTH